MPSESARAADATIRPVTERGLEDEEEHEEGRPDGRDLAEEASYVCGSCGEEIVVPLDPSAGESQSYVEDCPVCCVPNEITVEYEEDGSARVSSRVE